MTKCKACGREFRRGVIVMLLAGDVARSARVCQACASGGMTVVAAKVAPAPKREPDPLLPKVHKAIRQLCVLAKAAHVAEQQDAKGSPEANYQGGRLEGFEGAIKVIEREVLGQVSEEGPR